MPTRTPDEQRQIDELEKKFSVALDTDQALDDSEVDTGDDGKPEDDE